MTYDQVAPLTQVIALIFFFAMFIVVLAYAFWPRNKKRFEEAAKIPLENDPDEEPEDKTER